MAILAVAAWLAAVPLSVVNGTIAQSEGGAAVPAGFEHTPGEILFFSFQVQGYQPAGEKIHLRYRVQAFDPQGVPLVEPITGAVTAELAPQDKEWKPKVRQEIAIPPFAPPGSYKISVRVDDEVAKASATRDFPFEVRGRDVAPSPILAIRNFAFYRSENATEPLAKPVYRPGDAVWARFDITGHKFGEKNHIDVSYGVAVLNAEGKVLWSQAEAAVERTESFYPRRYVPGAMSINLQPSIRPGEYAIAITATDAVGKQTAETRQTFRVE